MHCICESFSYTLQKEILKQRILIIAVDKFGGDLSFTNKEILFDEGAYRIVCVIAILGTIHLLATKRFRVVLQCRVKPGEFTVHKSSLTSSEIWRVVDPIVVRPCGILVRKRKA